MPRFLTLIAAIMLATAANFTVIAANPGDGPFASLKNLINGSAQGNGEFLDPDQAFIVTAEAVDANTVRARWEIADHYYLYHDKFTFKIDGAGISVGEVKVPPGQVKEDPYFGKVEIMHGTFAVDISLLRHDASVRDIGLILGYQGCVEDGICYPPITKKLPVTLVPAGAIQASPPPGPTGAHDTPGSGRNGPPVSDTDRFTALLDTGTAASIIAGFFGVGLLLAFTPCVFPMVPILSGIIVGQGAALTRRRALLLSLTYVAAMALTYALAGVAAGLFGENLQAWFQKPWVIAAFAGIFLVLALSMFGFYELQLPSRWQTRLSEVSRRQRIGSLRGVAAMGVLSAVIVGPCVAPPLAGALVYIGKTGNAVLGAAALFVMALGMGAPLMLIGTSAGHLLPRAGAWMESVKKVFGVLMLAVAVWFLERILPAPLILLLWALLLIGSAMFLGVFDRLNPTSGGWRRLGKGLGLAMTVYGAALIVGAAGGHTDALRPLAGYTLAHRESGGAGALEFRTVRGTDGLKAALTQANGRPVLLDFYADWCIECKQLDNETFADATVRKALSGALLLRADVTANDATDQALLKDFGLYGPPAILFFGADGKERRPYRLQGFIGPQPFIKHLDTALATCSAQNRQLC